MSKGRILSLCSTLGYKEDLSATLRLFWKKTTAASGRKELFLIEEDLVQLADRWLNEEGNGEKYWKTKQRRRGLVMWGVDKDMITTTVRGIFVAQ